MLYFRNKHTFPPLDRMLEGNYLEQHKETAGGNLYYIDCKHKVFISAFCVVGDCQTPPTTEKKRSKELEMFLINHNIHQSFFKLVNTA